MADPIPTLAVRPRRYQPAETRQRIIDAASRLFREKGYASTSTADLAEAADVAEGSIFYHFGSKRALLEALGQAYAEGMVRAMLGDTTDLADLDPGDMVARCFDYCAIAGDPKDMIGIDPHINEGTSFEMASRDVVIRFVEQVMTAQRARFGLGSEQVRLKAAMTYAAVHDAMMRAFCEGVNAAEAQAIREEAVMFVRAVTSGYRQLATDVGRGQG